MLRLCLLCIPLLLIGCTTVSGDFFVSPKGDDLAAGNQSRPFRSIARAQEAVRERIAQGAEGEIKVVMRGGTYRVTEPITFGSRDSGNENLRVRYVAHPNEVPVVSGGVRINGWTVRKDGVWESSVASLQRGERRFRQLFVNGRRAQRARHPNSGYLRIVEAGEDKRTSFTADAGVIPAGDLGGSELLFLHDWSITRVRVKNMDHAVSRVTTMDPIGPSARHYAIDWFEKHPRFALENSPLFLDAPGEWVVDERERKLLYKPLPGEAPSKVEVVVPVARRLVTVAGDREAGSYVANLHFEGFQFEHVAWQPQLHGHPGRQASYFERRKATLAEGGPDPIYDVLPIVAAVDFSMAENCSLRRCVVQSVGGSGISMGSGCRKNRIVDTTVRDVSANGINVGEGSERRVDGGGWWSVKPEQAASGNVIERCLVENCGVQYFGAVGIWVGLAEKTTIRANEIRRLPYTGVSVGWKWWNKKPGTEPAHTPCKENLLEHNHIHHVMQELSDGGGIYTLGRQPGTILRRNLIHDVPVNAGRAESNGIFMDQGTMDVIIEDNVIHTIAKSPLRFHKGARNLVRNNVLACGDDAIPEVRYNDTDPKVIGLEGNVAVLDSDPTVAVEAAALLKEIKSVVDESR